jgi:hypothetical protein
MTTTDHTERNVPRLHAVGPTGTTRPDTAPLLTMAAFLDTHRLPLGDIAFLRDIGIVVDLSLRAQAHVYGDIVQWARALNGDVTTGPDKVDGHGLTVVHETRGHLPDMTPVHVVARTLVTVAS